MTRDPGWFDLDPATILDGVVDSPVTPPDGSASEIPMPRARRPSGGERDAAIREIVDALLPDTKLAVSGSSDSSRWERGWGEVLDRVKSERISESTLRPQYFRSSVIRYGGDFAVGDRPSVEFDAISLVKKILFARFFDAADNVVEFGCGTGINLLLLRRLFADKPLVGTDWAHAAVEIISRIGAEIGGPTRAAWMDMLTLDGADAVRVDPSSGVLTVCAMEQLGSRFEAFAEYLVASRPGIVVHLEPIAEFYRDDDLFDFLAARYHAKRGYLSGYLTWLRNQEKSGRVRIEVAARLPLGGFLHDPYGLVVWRSNC